MTPTENNGHDALTGFKTAKAFEKTFSHLLGAAVEKGESLAIAIIDLDNFRRFNEKYGNNYGDSALCNLAESVLRLLPENTIVGRFGGEEFIMLFPHMEREEAFLNLEKLRSEWDQDREISAGSRTIKARLTISGGITAHPADGSTLAEIMRKAEQALYRAKVTGRNRICLALEEKMVPKTAHFTVIQLERLSQLAKDEGVSEATLLREALDGLLRKYTVSEKLS